MPLNRKKRHSYLLAAGRKNSLFSNKKTSRRREVLLLKLSNVSARKNWQLIKLTLKRTFISLVSYRCGSRTLKLLENDKKITFLDNTAKFNVISQARKSKPRHCIILISGRVERSSATDCRLGFDSPSNQTTDHKNWYSRLPCLTFNIKRTV